MEPRTYSILVVDDSPADLYIVKEAFSECGFMCQLTTASSPQEAQQLLNKERFDLVLSDFGTDPNGARSFIRSVRARNQSLPIIVLSGSYNSNLAYESGANAFVRKSSDLQEIFAKIQGIMKFWVDVAEFPSPARSIAKHNFA